VGGGDAVVIEKTVVVIPWDVLGTQERAIKKWFVGGGLGLGPETREVSKKTSSVGQSRCLKKRGGLAIRGKVSVMFMVQGGLEISKRLIRW